MPCADRPWRSGLVSAVTRCPVSRAAFAAAVKYLVAAEYLSSCCWSTTFYRLARPNHHHHHHPPPCPSSDRVDSVLHSGSPWWWECKQHRGPPHPPCSSWCCSPVFVPLTGLLFAWSVRSTCSPSCDFVFCCVFFFCFSNLVVMRVYQAGGVPCSTKPDLDGSTVYFVVSRDNLAAYL